MKTLLLILLLYFNVFICFQLAVAVIQTVLDKMCVEIDCAYQRALRTVARVVPTPSAMVSSIV